ncbi:hypothetical protein [Longimicrobium sp.]|uniref:hypothetical protein n=1 Tax=Longimicrobium sp. TaxID=2029185 RepID=UPI003B3B152D
MAISRLRATTAALLLLASAACEDLTVPQLGGAYLGQVDSPFTVEGAVLFALPLTGLQSITTPNRVMFAQPIGDSLRVLIINRPDRAFGGPLSFVMQMDDGVPPQGGEVLAVSAPDNELRDFTGGFILRFSRDRTEGAVVPVVPAPAAPVGPYTLEQLVGHFFGVPVSAEVAAYMDSFGNASGAYDIGDVRQYLVGFPGQIPTDRTTWTR